MLWVGFLYHSGGVSHKERRTLYATHLPPSELLPITGVFSGVLQKGSLKDLQITVVQVEHPS